MPGLPHIRQAYWAPLAITGIFISSRIAFLLAGVHFDMTGLTGQFDVIQLLDLSQLHHNLVQSIWYLHSQPPFYNLLSGLLLQLPGGMIRPVLVLTSAALGLGLALSGYYLCLELHIPSAISLVLTVLVVLDPANVLYGNWYFYSFPTAVVMTFCALCLARFVRTRSLVWGFWFFGSLMTIVLLNSTFQWFWLVAASVPVLVVLRHRWKAVLAVAAVPLLLVSVWYVKNGVIFQSYATSSWFGMNLSKTTTNWATPGQLRRLEAKKKTLPTGGDSFLPLSAYGRELTSHGGTGVTVLDERVKSDGQPNFNNINYITISNRFLHDDIAFIEAYPDRYLHIVGRGALLFFVPSEQYVYLGTNSDHIAAYVNAFDLLVKWQPRNSNLILYPYGGAFVTPGQVSIGAVITFAIATLVTPFVVWRRRRDASFALVLAFIWVSIVYIFGATTLVDLGENQRFRYDLGPLPLVAAVAVVAALVTRIRGAGSNSDR
jgi:hypothetical protein